MKIVVAPDSFKESLSAPEVAAAMARGITLAAPHARIHCVPMADGGEGTVQAVLAGTQGERRTAVAQNALGEPIDADWALLGDGTAVIEMATAGGLEQIPRAKRDPLRASSAGVGQLISAALDAGARRIVLGLGGSATNDGGAGMLQALGMAFLDSDSRPLEPGGAALARLARIDAQGLDPRLRAVQFTIASDVDNPLCGAQGASAIFGPQKGANPEQVRQLDAALSRLADVFAQTLGRDDRNAPGSGAAGGLGFAARSWLGAGFRPGVEVVAEIGQLAEVVKGASLVFTGEGRMDSQTLRGKTPMGVARIAREAGVPVVAIAGSLGAGYQMLYGAGIHAAFSLAEGPCTLEEACRDAARLLADRASDIMRIWLAARHNVI
ncbi:MAG: glycerate kinase [Burkholderiaceae bacterium]|nr:glycerate kinase [Burkholderiaceae bacterium]